MKLLTFKGGVHPNDHKKETQDKAVIELKPSEIMVYPMSQHIGAPCTPTVNKGDRVLMGQVIGKSDAFVSAPIHSTVSGTVVAVEPRLHPNGTKVMSVVVENDFLDEKVDTIKELYEHAEKATRDLEGNNEAEKELKYWQGKRDAYKSVLDVLEIRHR